MADSRLQGVIYSLTQECGENVVDSGLVSVSANKFTLNGNLYYSDYDAKDLKYLFEYESNKGYYDDNTAPSLIIFDFKERKICVNKYTIHFGFLNLPSGRPQKWLLHGSNDNDTWTLIDDREKETKEHSDFEIEQYTPQSDTTTKFRFIRILISTHEYFWGDYSVFALTSIEFFDESLLNPPEELPHSISFQGTNGKFVNDSIGSVLLEGGTFTSILKRGI